jgi:hypothetical protein
VTWPNLFNISATCHYNPPECPFLQETVILNGSSNKVLYCAGTLGKWCQWWRFRNLIIMFYGWILRVSGREVWNMYRTLIHCLYFKNTVSSSQTCIPNTYRHERTKGKIIANLDALCSTLKSNLASSVNSASPFVV